MCKGRICACMILYAPFSLIDLQLDYFKKKKKKVLTFDSPPGVAGVCKDRICRCCCIRDSILFDMQHDHVLKQWNL